MNEIKDYIQIGVWVITVVSLYWKMRNDITLASAKAETDNQATRVVIETAHERIDKIEKDRNVKWGKYDDDYKRQNCKLNKIAVDIGELGENIKWIIKRIDKFDK